MKSSSTLPSRSRLERSSRLFLAEKEKTGTLIKAISFDIPILEYSNTNLWGTSLIDEDGNCNWIKEKE